jgi:hypothetical protein
MFLLLILSIPLFCFLTRIFSHFNPNLMFISYFKSYVYLLIQTLTLFFIPLILFLILSLPISLMLSLIPSLMLIIIYCSFLNSNFIPFLSLTVIVSCPYSLLNIIFILNLHSFLVLSMLLIHLYSFFFIFHLIPMLS